VVVVKNWLLEILKSRSDGPGVRVTESVRAAKSIIKVLSTALFPNSRSMVPQVPNFKLNDGREIPSVGFGKFSQANFKRLK